MMQRFRSIRKLQNPEFTDSVYVSHCLVCRARVRVRVVLSHRDTLSDALPKIQRARYTKKASQLLIAAFIYTFFFSPYSRHILGHLCVVATKISRNAAAFSYILDSNHLLSAILFSC